MDKTYFDAVPAFGLDTVFFQNKYYWPLSPMPALLLSHHRIFLLVPPNTAIW